MAILCSRHIFKGQFQGNLHTLFHVTKFDPHLYAESLLQLAEDKEPPEAITRQATEGTK